MENESQALTVISGPLPPAERLQLANDEIKFAEMISERLIKLLLDNNLLVKMEHKNKKTGKVTISYHVKFEGWAIVTKFYNCTIETESAKPVGEADEKRRFPGFSAKGRVVNVNGEVIGEAEAYCMRDEKRWEWAENFSIASMAQTRAGAKAAKQVFSWVMMMAQKILPGLSPTPADEMGATHNKVSEELFDPSAYIKAKDVDHDRFEAWLDLQCEQYPSMNKAGIMSHPDHLGRAIEGYKAIESATASPSQVPQQANAPAGVAGGTGEEKATAGLSGLKLSAVQAELENYNARYKTAHTMEVFNQWIADTISAGVTIESLERCKAEMLWNEFIDAVGKEEDE